MATVVTSASITRAWNIARNALSRRDVGYDVSAILNPRFRSRLIENALRISGYGVDMAVAICRITNDVAIVSVE